VFGVAAGSLLLGDRLEPIQWLGTVVVAVAVVAIALRPALDRPPQPAVVVRS
jgi:drug/metabolite transporter (DMT)-like permease